MHCTPCNRCWCKYVCGAHGNNTYSWTGETCVCGVCLNVSVCVVCVVCECVCGDLLIFLAARNGSFLLFGATKTLHHWGHLCRWREQVLGVVRGPRPRRLDWFHVDFTQHTAAHLEDKIFVFYVGPILPIVHAPRVDLHACKHVAYRVNTQHTHTGNCGMHYK